MIVTVTANPALDLTWHVASLTLGGVHRADAGRARAGGKGLNVARVAHAQGAAVVAVATTGGETGAEFAAELDAAGVPHVLVPVAAATRRSIALVDEAEGDTTIVNERGVAPTAAEWAALKDAVASALAGAGAGARAGATPGATPGGRDRVPGPSSAGYESGADTPDVGPIRGKRPSSGVSAPEVQRTDAVTEARTGTDVLVISGSFPPGTPDDLLPALIRIGRDAGATVIADTSGPALLMAADAGASVLKPNEHELRDATGLDDPVDGARELLRRGAELVLLSLGKDGMLAVSAVSADRAPAGCESGADTPDVGPIRGKRPSPGVSAPEVERREGTDAGNRADAGNRPAAGPAVGVLHARLDTPLAGNPTGAGDAGVAACAVLMDAGIRDPERILRRATAWSAAAVLMPLAGDIHPSWPALEAALTVTTRPAASAHPAAPGAATSAETVPPARDAGADGMPGSRAETSSAASDPKESR